MFTLADFIFDNPETAFNEVKASRKLVEFLEENGFKTQYGLGSLSTAFKAVYENGKGGPSIGFLCEYDALVGLGHACAHHMQGPSVAVAAIAIKNLIEDKPYKIVIYGTPAEEGGGGKITMLQEKNFQDIDLALMMHGGPATQTDIKSLAASSLNVTFHGKSSHAALKPEMGRSAFDALLLTFQAVEFLREHVKEDTRMHYTVTNAGGPCNIVPETAQGSFSIRSYNSVYLDHVISRFENIVKGASLMTDTKFSIEVEKRLESKVPVNKLNNLLMENAALIDAPNQKPSREKTGSTDFGNVTYIMPGACIRTAFVDEDASSHSMEFLQDGKSNRGHQAILNAAKILAGTAYDLITQPYLLEEIKNEFLSTKLKMSIK
jgi:amidohydrolase